MSEGETIPRCDTWMPFYVNDYLGDTMHLTTEQHGAYFLLLLACWKRGGVLPNEEAQLAAIAKLALPKWRAMRTVILGFFLIADTTLTHKRVNAELANAQDKVTAKQKSGKAGGIAARGKSGRPKSVTNNGTAILSPLKNGPEKIAEELRNNTPSPSPYSVPKEGTGAAGVADPVKALFEFGRSVLCEAGVSDKNARSLVGKWRSGIGDDGRLMALLVSARKNHAQEPVSYIEAALKKDADRAKFGGGYVPQHPGAGG